MSQITNDGLTQSGTGCFIAVPLGNGGCQRVNLTKQAAKPMAWLWYLQQIQ